MAPSTATRTRAFVEDASAPLVGDHAQTAELNLEGSRGALVFYRRDPRESERRRRHHHATPLRLGDLATLMQLPVDIPVRLDQLPAPQQTKILALPKAAADITRDHVRRRAVRPLTVDLIVVRARGTHWSDGLDRASRFAPFARRALLVDAPAHQRDDLLMQAAFYGIGILETADGDPTWTLQPEPHRPRHHTPAAWHFIEQLHARLP